MNRGLIFTGFAEHYPSIERTGGAYRMAHYLRQFNWDIEVVDYLAHWTMTNLVLLVNHRYRQGSLKWIGISATWLLTHPNVKDLCKYIKARYPEVVIIVGGQNILGPNLRANYYVSGFGELAAKAILEYEFSNGKKPYGKPFYDGWAIDALHFYPSWPMEDYTVNYELRDFLQPTDGVSLEVSRGCKFSCKFCTFPVLGVKEDNSISEELMYKHFVKTHDQWGIKNYTLADETLNDRNAKLEKLSRAVQRSGIEPNLNAFIRIDLLKSNPQQLELLAGARVWGQFYGVETFNRKAGSAVGKGLDPDTVKELMLNARSYMNKHVGYYRGTASFIAGLPYESVEDLYNTHQWLTDNWTDQNWIVWLLGIPETSDNTRLSIFGKDIGKYGYSRMTQEEVDFELSKNNTIRRPMNLFESNQIYWKNAYGNYFTFQKVANEIDGLNQCREGNFYIWGKMSLGLSIEEAIERKIGDDTSALYDLLKIKVNEYIDKKLSL